MPETRRPLRRTRGKHRRPAEPGQVRTQATRIVVPAIVLASLGGSAASIATAQTSLASAASTAHAITALAPTSQRPWIY